MVEILFAITVMNLGILPLMLLLVGSTARPTAATMASTTRHAELNQAAQLAQQRLDDFKRDIAASWASRLTCDGALNAEGPDYPDFQWRCQRTELLQQGGVDGRIVRLQITVFRDRNNDSAIQDYEPSFVLYGLVTSRESAW